MGVSLSIGGSILLCTFQHFGKDDYIQGQRLSHKNKHHYWPNKGPRIRTKSVHNLPSFLHIVGGCTYMGDKKVKTVWKNIIP